MKTFSTLCAAAALTLAAIQPAAAESDPQTSDIRCLVVGFQMMGNATDEATKSAAMVTTMYYLGKLDGRSQGLDLEKAIIEQIEALKQGGLDTEAQRCGGELQQRGKTLETLGDALTKKGY